jgi:hypothetical protein
VQAVTARTAPMTRLGRRQRSGSIGGMVADGVRRIGGGRRAPNLGHT